MGNDADSHRTRSAATFSRHMKTSDQRMLVAWLLVLCMGLSVFACSVRHGQSMGLALSGVFDGGFCSLSGTVHGLKGDVSDPANGLGELLFLKCPFCGSVSVGAVALLALVWLLRLDAGSPLRPRDEHRRIPPRDERPPLNPQAP